MNLINYFSSFFDKYNKKYLILNDGDEKETLEMKLNFFSNFFNQESNSKNISTSESKLEFNPEININSFVFPCSNGNGDEYSV